MVKFQTAGLALDQDQSGAVAVKLMAGIAESVRVAVVEMGRLAFPVSVCHPEALLRVAMKDEI